MTTQAGKPVVLIICDYYLPGFESGGAMRTIVNTTARLGDEFDFRIVTRDHDGPNNLTPYGGIVTDGWNTAAGTPVYYLSRQHVRPATIRRLIAEVGPDTIYLNSFFSRLTTFVLLLRKLRRIASIPVILAPEGEFSPGALSLKKGKKSLYIAGAKSLGLLKDLVWKAGSDSEGNDIRAALGDKLNIMVAPNMPPATMNEGYIQSDKPKKTAGQACMIFLSRVMRKKNLKWLLENLRGIEGELVIDICGPVEDADYWSETQQVIETLPTNITVTLKEAVSHDRVRDTLLQYHFFILPTLGENFGHVFIEALAAGCPLVISDRTPWRDLESRGIGWDLPIEDVVPWRVVIDKCLRMDQDVYTRMSQGARRFALDWLADPSVEGSNRDLLHGAVNNKALRR